MRKMLVVALLVALSTGGGVAEDNPAPALEGTQWSFAQYTREGITRVPDDYASEMATDLARYGVVNVQVRMLAMGVLFEEGEARYRNEMYIRGQGRFQEAMKGASPYYGFQDLGSGRYVHEWVNGYTVYTDEPGVLHMGMDVYDWAVEGESLTLTGKDETNVAGEVIVYRAK